jgi:8-oxo-dGDP phosphatase
VTQPHDVRDVPEQWPVESSEDVFRHPPVPFAIRTDVVRRPGEHDEAPFRRLLVEHPGAVVVLALDEQDRALCLRQYRHPVQMKLLELPAGLLDKPGEPPVDAAVRELQEEAGLAASSWTTLGAAYASPGLTSEKIHYFLARGLEDVGRGDFVLAHEEADMQTLWVPFEELYAACLDGRVEDAPVVLAVLLARTRGLV